MAAIEPTATDCAATLTAQLGMAEDDGSASVQVGSYVAIALSTVAPLSPPSPALLPPTSVGSGTGKLTSASGDGTLAIATISGAAGVAILLGALVVLFWHGKKRRLSGRGDGGKPGKQQCVELGQGATADTLKLPSTPSPQPMKRSSRVDALAMALTSHAGAARKAAAKARQRSNGDLEEQSEAAPKQSTTPALVLTEHTAMTAPAPPAMVDPTFVPQLGWMSASAAKKLGKRVYKGPQAAEVASAHRVLYASAMTSVAV